MNLSEERLSRLPQELQRAATVTLHEGMFAEAAQR